MLASCRATRQDPNLQLASSTRSDDWVKDQLSGDWANGVFKSTVELEESSATNAISMDWTRRAVELADDHDHDSAASQPFGTFARFYETATNFDEQR